MVDTEQAKRSLHKLMHRHCHNLTLTVTPAGETDKARVVAEYRLPSRRIAPGDQPDEKLTMAERLATRYEPKGDVVAEAVKHAIPTGSYSITHPTHTNETHVVVSKPTQTRIEFLADAAQLEKLSMALVLKGVEEPMQDRNR